MNRQKKIVLLAHCLLNSNSKVGGSVLYQGAQEKLLLFLVKKGYGIIQLPCPEMTMFGSRRWGQVREQYDTPRYRRHCREIFEPVLEQVGDYLKNGYFVEALIGIDGSPSCGVEKSCSSGTWGGEIGARYGFDQDIKVIPARGIFMEEIESLLSQHGVPLKLIAFDETRPESWIDDFARTL
jgi:predicted secreted protein